MNTTLNYNELVMFVYLRILIYNLNTTLGENMVEPECESEPKWKAMPWDCH